MAERKIATTKVAGTWAWALQRLSAMLLIVFLAVHIYADHFMDLGEETGNEPLITFEDVSIRLDQLFYIIVDYGMLSMVLFHGLNGLRTVMFDFDMFTKRQRLVDVGFWILGLVTLVWGIIILLPFITGSGG